MTHTQMKRYEVVLFAHPTAMLEIVVGLLGSAVRGLLLLVAPAGLPGEPLWGLRVWGASLIVVGLAQVYAAGARHWRLRAWVATVTAWLFAGRLMVVWRHLPMGWGEVVFFISPLLVQLYIAWRVWHDREVASLSFERRQGLKPVRIERRRGALR